jgi:multidrug resistance efflux pump
VQLRAAEVDWKRTKELHDRGSIAPATFDAVQARYDSAKTSVSQANTIALAGFPRFWPATPALNEASPPL